MDTNQNQHQKSTNEPSIRVSSWYQQQPTQFSSRYDVVLVQPAHSDESIHNGIEPIPDYTVLSVFTMIFCCLPIGICALMNARASTKLLTLGRREEVLERSIISRNVNISAMIVGPIVAVISVVLNIYVFSHLRNPNRNGFLG